MATRKKTISYAFDMVTSVITNNTLTALTQITVDIPETVIAFDSAFLEVGFQDIITVTGGTITNSRVDLQLQGAGAPTTVNYGSIANTGENIALVLAPIDYTAHFTTNWTGTSRTCDVSVLFNQTTGTTFGMRNVTAILHITYSYDDDPATNPTQIKTVRIPFDANSDGLTTTANTFFDTIPQLTGAGGMLPEDSVVIKDYFFVFEGSEGAGGTTNFTPTANIDSGTAYPFGEIERALASDRWDRFVWRPTVPDPTTTHDLQLWQTGSAVTTLFRGMSVTLVVTYTFDVAASTRILNSIQVPLEFASPLGRNNAAGASRFVREIMVSEGGTIELRQSAFRVNWNTTAAVTTGWRAGGQAYRTYAITSTQVCGMINTQQRIDAGGVQGAGMTLARGANKITIDGYSAGALTVPVTNINGYIMLNYISDKSSLGVGAHSKTTYSRMLPFNATAAIWDVLAYSYSIPETNYYFVSTTIAVVAAFTANGAVTLDAKLLAGEGKGAGYTDIYTDVISTDPEIGTTMAWFRCGSAITRAPQFPKTGIDVTQSRDYRFQTVVATRQGLYFAPTYHSLTWALAGDFIGTFDPALPTELHLQRRDTMEIEQVQNLSAGVDDYSFTVYNDVIEYRVIAFQDSTHVATTAWGTAT